MPVSLAGSISRAIGKYNSDIRTQERAVSTGKKALSQLNPADLVQISSLYRATQGLDGARNNIAIAIQKLNTLANGIQNQLDIVNKAYALAEVVTTNTNLTAADLINMDLQYQALLGANGSLQSAAAATTDINGNALVNAAIDAIVATNPATVVNFAAVDSGQATLFANAANAANGSAGAASDITTQANAQVLISGVNPVLPAAQGILSNYLAKIENQIDLLTSVSDSLGEAGDAAGDQMREIADIDPIEAANAIKNDQGAKNLLAGLLTNDAQDANNVMNYARGILALPV